MNRNFKIILSVFFFLSFFIFSFLYCEKNSTSPEEDFDPTQNPYKLTKGEYPDWCHPRDSIAFVRDGSLWVVQSNQRSKVRILSPLLLKPEMTSRAFFVELPPRFFSKTKKLNSPQNI